MSKSNVSYFFTSNWHVRDQAGSFSPTCLTISIASKLFSGIVIDHQKENLFLQTLSRLYHAAKLRCKSSSVVLLCQVRFQRTHFSFESEIISSDFTQTNNMNNFTGNHSSNLKIFTISKSRTPELVFLKGRVTVKNSSDKLVLDILELIHQNLDPRKVW